MVNLRKKLKTIRETTDTLNQSSTGADTVEKLADELQLSDSLDDRREINAVDEYHYHHESLDAETLENSSSSKLHLDNSNEDDLNEDCLLEIFSYLSLDKMMQVKIVCKRWYQVSQQWFKQVQTLTYYQEYRRNGILEISDKYEKRILYKKDINIDSFNDLISILHSCGHHIKYYVADFRNEDMNRPGEREKFMFQWVPKFCKNIVDVRIYGGEEFYTPSTFEIMATYWRKLEYIEIVKLIPQSLEEHFYELLRNNKQLKTFVLTFEYGSATRINDNFFTYLPTTIENIIIQNMSIDNTEQLSHFICASKNFTSLQSLDLSSFHHLTDAVSAAITDIKSLTHLSLFDVESYESRRTIDSIAKLKDLKSLFLEHIDDLYEDNIITIVENCIQLKVLFITNDDVLTDRGFTAIAKLKNLKCLDIKMKNVNVELIIRLCDRLEVLACTYSKMNNSDAIKLLKKGTNLRFVDFSFCNNVTKDVLEAANKIANERKYNILWIFTGYRRFVDVDDIDTPYFKYFRDDCHIPWEIIPDDFSDYMNSKFS